jgi:3',5'-cyclic AMP phosphodiesterase CpdA
VIATGDLTHRGRREQHERAAAFLRGLGVPVLAVPGNHDIPYRLPARVTTPWVEFERQWETTEPEFATDKLHVVGVNSVRPWRHQSGAVRNSQLERVRDKLAGAATGALRVVALHHQLVNAPWRTRKRPVSRRGHVLHAFADAGADLILGGHVHQATVSERREFEAGGGRAAVLSIAPGLGRPRPRRLGEASGCVLYTVDDTMLRVETWISGARVATREFPRSY